MALRRSRRSPLTLRCLDSTVLTWVYDGGPSVVTVLTLSSGRTPEVIEAVLPLKQKRGGEDGEWNMYNLVWYVFDV